MDKTIDALHAAGVAAPWIAGLVFVWLAFQFGPGLIKQISASVLEHRRFDLEREVSEQTIQIARDGRQAELTLGGAQPTKAQFKLKSPPKTPRRARKPIEKPDVNS